MKTNVAEFEVHGLKEVMDKLNSFPLKAAEKIERAAMRKVIKTLEDAAKANTPRGKTGNLQAGIRVGTRLNKASATLTGFVKNIAPHANLVEYGHIIKPRGKDRKSRKSPNRKDAPRKESKTLEQRLGIEERKTTGIVAARPFMRPALLSNQDNIINLLTESVNDAINEVLAIGASQ